MRQIKNLLDKYDLKPKRYDKRGKVTIIETKQGKFVVRERKQDRDQSIFRYLKARQFNYYPMRINNEEDDYEIMEYIDEVDMPPEQKMSDMVDLVTLLHNKTTYYQETTEDDYKQIYEDISNNIAYLDSYYQDIITVIESKVYMSPSEYLLARNISIIFAALNFCKQQLDDWFDIVKDKKKGRYVVLHNNLELDHFLRNENSYLISWDKARIDIPIFDLYKLYVKHGLDCDFESILKHYESHYPLFKEERMLLFILISLPGKIEFDQKEYEMCQMISKQIDILYKSENLISSYTKE